MASDTSKYEQLQVAQVADLNPGIRAGLFWTLPVTDDAVSVDLTRGTTPAEGAFVVLLDGIAGADVWVRRTSAA